MSGRWKRNLTALQLILYMLILVFGCVERSSVEPNRNGDYRGSISWDGVERTYLIHIPNSYDKNKSIPLVIILHGGGGTADGTVKLTKGGFNSLADKEGFIVLYPEGNVHLRFPRTRWNDGRDERFSQSDDVGFISALIDYLVKTLKVDKNRVYVTGISNGAHMAMRLARELSDKITAVAAVAYSMQKKYEQVPPSKEPISFLIMTGTKDPILPWDGGGTPDLTGTRLLGEILSVPETIEVLVSHNGCSPMPIITYEPDRDPNDTTRARKVVYKDCMDGTEVVLYAIEGGGHTWPGGWQYLPERIVGITSMDIDANKIIWDFFKRHIRK